MFSKIYGYGFIFFLVDTEKALKESEEARRKVKLLASLRHYHIVNDDKP
jgi:hypothetical protein